MKKAQREAWVAITGANYVAVLCAFCKYGLYEGDCKDGYYVCEHPLDVVYEMLHAPYGIEPGDDCWGFRPTIKLDVAADIVGMWLQGQAVDRRDLA